jgi:AcrR family transcriptional regulator
MARWEPGARERLQKAALDLFLERGYENVTATDIAEHAGLARRTFFRYFADKREVLFAGSEQLPAAAIEAVHATPTALSALDAVLHALDLIGTRLAEYGQHAGERRTVIASSAELQERERTKLAALTTALARALSEREVPNATAELLAHVGVATFQAAWGQWVDQAGNASFHDCFEQATADLKSAFAA